jgi:hypothetical protein
MIQQLRLSAGTGNNSGMTALKVSQFNRSSILAKAIFI